jgi:hypothetical protein
MHPAGERAAVDAADADLQTAARSVRYWPGSNAKPSGASKPTTIASSVSRSTLLTRSGWKWSAIRWV